MQPPMRGWILFASIMLLAVGTLAFFEGLIAVIRKHYFVVSSNQVIVFDMTTWGWITLVWGAALVLVGFALWGGASWARWVAIVLASLNILEALGWLGSTAYPLWTLVIVGINIIVLYALTARWEGYRATQAERAHAERAQLDDDAHASAGTSDPATQIARAKDLLDSGTINQAEFESIKQRALA